MTAEDITIEHRASDTGGRFVLLDAGREVGELDYVWQGPGVMNAHHTGVRDSHTRRGLARRLVDAAAAFAREEGHRIAPTCSYAIQVLDDDAYDDVRG
ncbi:MAG: GNAT family N-acetyltransferase [Sandaracinaceae bacterium]